MDLEVLEPLFETILIIPSLLHLCGELDPVCPGAKVDGDRMEEKEAQGFIKY